MRSWNLYAWAMMGALMFVQVGCAKPGPTPGPSTNTGKAARSTGGQQGSTTGGGTEVPMPATPETTPSATETPAATEPAPATESTENKTPATESTEPKAP